MTTSPLLFHRSASVTDWLCPRKRYYNYEFDGRGIAPPESAYELYLGTLIHDGVAAMSSHVPIDEIVLAGVKQLRAKLLEGRELDSDAQYLADEQCALAEGMLRGFYRLHWPRIEEAYPTPVVCEEELIYDYELHGRPLRFLAKPDLVRRDAEGQLWYFEWKTTGSNKDEWVHQWETAVQLHSAGKAIEARFNEPVAGMIVQGFYKSYVSQYNRLESIFCYGYHHPGNPPFEKARWAYEWKNGMRKAPTWTRDGGVKKWVEEMPVSILASQFPQTPPIFINDQIVQTFFRQQGYREIQIKAADPASEESMDRTFPMHFDSCNAWNRLCGYKRLCFGAPCDPYEVGFTPRVSHHALEQESLDANN